MIFQSGMIAPKSVFRVPELSLNRQYTDSDIQLRKNTRQEREGRAAEVESELW